MKKQVFRYKQLPWLLIGCIVLVVLFGLIVFLSSSNKPLKFTGSFQYPSPSPIPSSVSYPSAVLDLQKWKLTIPQGNSEKPTEIKQPILETYVLPPWFQLTDDLKAVRFRAPVSAVTTKGSNYPRSELREMTGNDGRTNASWSSSVGRHTMTVDQAITAVPKTKQHVVAGQIHDADDDVIVIRLEYPNLYINVDGKNVYTLDNNYTLGKRFTFAFDVKGGKTDVYYDNSQKPVYTLKKNYTGAYFKAGVYTQSNCSKEKNIDCNETNFSEVIIYSLRVLH